MEKSVKLFLPVCQFWLTIGWIRPFKGRVRPQGNICSKEMDQEFRSDQLAPVRKSTRSTGLDGCPPEKPRSL